MRQRYSLVDVQWKIESCLQIVGRLATKIVLREGLNQNSRKFFTKTYDGETWMSILV